MATPRTVVIHVRKLPTESDVSPPLPDQLGCFSANPRPTWMKKTAISPELVGVVLTGNILGPGGDWGRSDRNRDGRNRGSGGQGAGAEAAGTEAGGAEAANTQRDGICPGRLSPCHDTAAPSPATEKRRKP